MNRNTRIAAVIAGIATVVAMGIGAPAFAGQNSHDSDYARHHRAEEQAKALRARRRWQMAHNHNKNRGAWNSNVSHNGHSYGNSRSDYDGVHGNWNGNHYGWNKNSRHDVNSHRWQNDQNRSDHRNNDQNHGNRDRNDQDRDNRGQQDDQRNHQHEGHGNNGH